MYSTKLVLSKHFIQVHLEILGHSVEKIASHSLTKYITWGKSCQSLCSLKSRIHCTRTSCIWLPFLIGQVCSQVWCCPCLAANFGLFELRSFPWSPSNAEVVTFYPFTLKVGFKYTSILHSTVPFKSKLTLNSRSSWESRIENRVQNQDSILDCCVSILGSRFLWDSSNWNDVCLVSSNSLSTLDTWLLWKSTSNSLCLSFE